jgi:hypothetical protein
MHTDLIKSNGENSDSGITAGGRVCLPSLFNDVPQLRALYRVVLYDNGAVIYVFMYGQ